jgi:hypothetical protein
MRVERLIRKDKEGQEGLSSDEERRLNSPPPAGVVPACPCLSSCEQTKLTESLLQPFRPLGMRATQLGKLFGEHFLWASALFAEEAAHVNDEANRTSTGWKIAQRARIVAVHPPGDGFTRRARCRWRRWTQGECNFISYVNVLDEAIGKIWKNDHWVQSCTSKKRKNFEKLFNLLVYHLWRHQGCVRTNNPDE